MKLNKSKEWYATKFAKEGVTEVGAGLGFPSADNRNTRNARVVFGKFVQLWRRDKGWRAEELAEAADVDEEDILEIEMESDTTIMPTVVQRLAKVFSVDENRLLLMAGGSETLLVMREREVPYRAQAENTEPLSYLEKELLQQFISALVKG